MGNLEDIRMKGLLMAQVYLFFKFSYEGVDYPCTLVHWYPTSTEPDPTTGFWVVQPELNHRVGPHAGVIHLDSII